MRSPAEARPMALGRSPDPLDQVDYRLAQTPEEKDEIFRLRYRAYLREGAIKPSTDGRVIDQFEDAPNAWTFGVYFHGELYSSIRVSVLTSEWRMSPSVELFGEVLHPELDKGRVIIDSTIVRPEHQAFYRRVFLHETWCEPRTYPGLVKPVGLMAAHLPTVRDRVLARYPFLRSSAFERRTLFERDGERPSLSDAVVNSFEPASIVPSS